MTQSYELPGLIVVRRNPNSAPLGTANSVGKVPPEVLRKYGGGRPLFRPKPRRLKRKKDEE